MRIVLALGLQALASPVAAQSVVETDFTISVPRTGQEDLVESTTLVPLLEGVCYDWYLRLAKSKGPVEIVEVYTLPAPPANWELDDDTATKVSPDQMTATTPLTLTPQDGWIGSGWCVSAGDPEGDYFIEVKAGERVLHRFPFQLKQM